MKPFYPAVFSLIILLTSCVKNPIELYSPQVPAYGSMARSFIYPATNNSAGVTYNTNPDSLFTTAEIDAQNRLLITVDEPVLRGKDFVKFTIEGADIKTGYAGEYAITPSILSGLQGQAQVNYRYRNGTYSYVEFLPGNATGTLKISSYDAYRKTISGNYIIRINSLHDPRVGMNWVETKIDISGYFEGTPLTK